MGKNADGPCVLDTFEEVINVRRCEEDVRNLYL